MKCSRLKNSRGLTLVELLVALGLSSVVMTAMISGVLFLQRQMQRWSDDTQWVEEISFARTRLAAILTHSIATDVFDDSIVCRDTGGRRQTISWPDSILTLNNKPLLRHGIAVSPFTVAAYLPPAAGNIESIESGPPGRRSLRISFAIRGKRHSSTPIIFVVREVYAYSTFAIRRNTP